MIRFRPFRFMPLRSLGSATLAMDWTGSKMAGSALVALYPTNTNGGQLSHAQLNGWGQLRELMLQLRGEAGARQVTGARRGMWASCCGDALIFERL